jgi:hypothetical protein
MVMNFEHIHPEYRGFAELSDPERIDWIRADRWINYPRAERALQQLEELLSYPPRDRMPCLLIYGNTGMGKTKIIRKFERTHPSSFNEGTGMMVLPIVSFQMPPEPDEQQFYDEMFKAIGMPRDDHWAKDRRLQRVRHISRETLKTVGARMIIIDEIHSMLAGTPRAQRIFLNLIRFLANDLRVPIVCFGTDEACHAFLTDSQLAERFDAFALPRWTNDEALRKLVASLGAILPLRQPSKLDAPVVRKCILDMTAGVTNRIFRLIETVAVAGIRSGRECIDEQSFSADDLVLPLVSMTRNARRAPKTVMAAP